MTPSEEEFLENLPKKATSSYNDDSGQDDSLKRNAIILPTNLKSKTPGNFGVMTEMAEEGKLDPVWWTKRKEIERVCQDFKSTKRTTRLSVSLV
jgi:ATP-dependent Clp protease ATP-binding subunit ClpC